MIGLRYTGSFQNVENDLYTVNIYKEGYTGSAEEILLSGDPVIIDYEIDKDIFKPVKLSGCSINVLTKKILSDLYTGKITDVKIDILKNGELWWTGYNSPNVYNSEFYSDADSMTIEAIDTLSVLKYIRYEYTNISPVHSYKIYLGKTTNYARTYEGNGTDYYISYLAINGMRVALTLNSPNGSVIFKIDMGQSVDNAIRAYAKGLSSVGIYVSYADGIITIKSYNPISYIGYFISEVKDEVQSQITPFSDIILHCLNKVVPSDMELWLLSGMGTDILDNLTIQERNFFDEDLEPITCLEVLEHIARFFGLQFCQWNRQIRIFDLEQYYTSGEKTYRIYQMDGSSKVWKGGNTVYPERIAKNNCTISYGDVYNKVSVVANTMSVDQDNATNGDWFDIANMDQNGVTDTITDNGYTYYIQNYNSSILTQYNYIEKETVSNYYPRPDTSGDEGSIVGTIKEYNYDYSYNKTTVKPSYDPKYVNATFTRSASFSSSESYPDPHWDTYITCNLGGNKDTLDTEMKWAMKRRVKSNDLPLLYYKSVKTLGHLNSSSPKNVYIIISGSGKLSDTFYDSKTGSTDNADYRQLSGGGYRFLDAILKIGDKFWNGSEWVTTECRFPLRFGNDECKINTWYEVTNTVDYSLELKNRGLQIEIKPSDNLSGNIEFYIYPAQPLYDDQSFKTEYHHYRSDNGFDIMDGDGGYDYRYIKYGDYRADPNMLDTTYIPAPDIESYAVTNVIDVYPFYIAPYVLLKDMQLNFESLVGDFFDTKENQEEDILYTNMLNEEVITEMDSIELYCNTMNTDFNTSLSYSFVMDKDHKYISTLNKNGTVLRPEEHLVIMYSNHYSYPKLIYQNTVTCSYKDYESYLEPIDAMYIPSLDKTLVMGSISYNLRYETADVTIYEL